MSSKHPVHRGSPQYVKLSAHRTAADKYKYLGSWHNDA